jgi:hypothetical protein
MAERTQMVGRVTAALARRLLLVALFALGLGEGPLGGDGASARAALEADRALAHVAGDAPLPTQFLEEADRGHGAKAGFSGEDFRTLGLADRLFAAPKAASGALPQSRPAPAPEYGFSSRAPPSFA